METLKRITIYTLALGLLVLADTGCRVEKAPPMADLGWPTSLPDALGKARSENKVVLVNFTGSDWCPGCIQLNRKVLSTEEFEAYAGKNLELVEVDFPEKKKLPDDLKKANEALAKQYDVNGFPTLILLDADGKVLNKDEGYGKAKPAEFIAALEKARKKG